MNPLDRKPEDLGERHTAVARLLLGRPEGVTRQEGARYLGMEDDRAFRELCSEIAISRWLPIVTERTGRGARLYRIAGPNEQDLCNAASREDKTRAISLHKRAKGRIEAFKAHHSAGSLFLEDVPEELEHA